MKHQQLVRSPLLPTTHVSVRMVFGDFPGIAWKLLRITNIHLPTDNTPSKLTQNLHILIWTR